MASDDLSDDFACRCAAFPPRDHKPSGMHACAHHGAHSPQVRGFPPARTQAERRDATLLPLLGGPHDDGAPQGSCMCALCTFNRGDPPATRSPPKCASLICPPTSEAAGDEEAAGEAAGEAAVEAAGEAAVDGKAAGVAGLCHVAPRVMVADAKECGEGISFFGVRRLLLADVPVNAEEWIQRVGRAVRFMGHGALPPDERHVQVRLIASLIASLPSMQVLTTAPAPPHRFACTWLPRSQERRLRRARMRCCSRGCSVTSTVTAPRSTRWLRPLLASLIASLVASLDCHLLEHHPTDEPLIAIYSSITQLHPTDEPLIAIYSSITQLTNP
jgi:hypothetical protein